jgi:hypothetical protein
MIVYYSGAMNNSLSNSANKKAHKSVDDKYIYYLTSATSYGIFSRL